MASPANRRRPSPGSSSTAIEMNDSASKNSVLNTVGENHASGSAVSSLNKEGKGGTTHAGENESDADASPLENDIGVLMHENTRTIDSFLESAYHRNNYSLGTLLHAEEESSILSDLCDRNKLAYHLIILSLGLANASDASEILCLSYLLSDRNFQQDILKSGDINNGNSGGHFESGLIAASVFIGMLSGGLVVGAVADSLGRRPTLLFGLILNAVAGMLSALSTNAYNLAAIRLIAGVGIGASIPPLFSLVSELSPPTRRGLCVNIVASFWMVGSIYVALIAILSFQTHDWSWRIFAVLCAVPSLAGAVAVWMVVPASPRFLAKIGMVEEATEIANTLAIKMGANTMPVGATFSHENTREEDSGAFRLLQRDELAQQYPQSQTNRFTGRRNFDIKSAVADGIKSTKDLYSRNLRKGITIPLQVIWFALSFGSYGLLTWINSIFVQINLSNVYFNALLFAAANLPGNILAGALLDRIGRRRLLTLSMGFSALSLIIFAHYSQVRSDVDVPNANTAMTVLSACTFQAFSIAAWNAIDTITGEEFPTSVRSTGLGICTASGRIGALIAQFVNSWLIDEPARLLLVASATLLFGAASPLLLEGQDMARRNLEDNPSEHHRNMVIDQAHQHASADSHGRRPVGYDSLYSATSRRNSSSSRPLVFLTLFGLISVLLIEPMSGLALPPPAPRPECYKSAVDIPPPPIDDDPFQPSPLDDAFVAAFRWTLQRQSGQVSDVPGYDGMMRELIDFRVEHGPDELERVSYQTMVALAGPVPFIYKTFFGSLEATPAILSWFAKWLLPFLVGDMSLTSRGEDDPRGGGVLVHRCRVLEGSGCKGVCAKMCKVPTQRFFAEQWGVPLTMSPNFASGECQLIFGKEPLPIEEDPTIPLGCLSRCPASAIMENTDIDKC